MKKLLSILLMGISTIVYSQNDTAHNKYGFDSASYISMHVGFISIVYADSLNKRNAIYISIPDSTITIEGDTIKVIRLLLKQMQRGDSIELSHYKFVSAAVDFTNNVPDYFKRKENNKAWKKYLLELKKNGFVVGRKK